IPKYALLAMSLPVADETWLLSFSKGFMTQAEKYGVELIGGDTTKGPLAICIQIIGELDAEFALRRDGAKPGDEIWVSGNLGDAALALSHLNGEIMLAEDQAEYCLRALRDPVPRVELGLALAGISRCAIDISDGFCADLSHILEKSNVSAVVEYGSLPVSETMEKFRSMKAGQRAILSGGDDYELCFTASPEKSIDVISTGKSLGMKLAKVGKIAEGRGLVVLDGGGRPMNTGKKGYAHFS
ncbi:MAG TPA: thiamine-phosphate kinase, partial [Burkholderiales bacterium]|nr:thiamine-phosphate kinase [Burkholderiales bacterium]